MNGKPFKQKESKVPCIIHRKNRDSLPLVVFKNDRLRGWGDKRSGDRKSGQRDGLDDDVVRRRKRAIAQSKIQVGKGLLHQCVVETFLIGQGVGRDHDQQDEKKQLQHGLWILMAPRGTFLRENMYIVIVG